MKVKNIYPEQNNSKRLHIRNAVRWAFLAAAYVCLIVNISAGGKAWSVVVLWSLWSVWSLVLSPDLVEYNRISQISKLMAFTCILLILIDTLISPGWAMFVVPIICWGVLLIIGTLFLLDMTRQTQNIMPMLWVIFASIVSIILSWAGWPKMSWPVVALGTTAFALLIVCIAVLRKRLMLELKKRFHTK